MPNEMQELEAACVEAKAVADIKDVVWLEADAQKAALHARRGYKPVELDGVAVVVEELQLYSK